MSIGRPEILFPLFAALTGLESVGPKTAELLGKLDIERPRDLLFTLPSGGTDRSLRPTILGLTFPQTVTVEVEIGLHQPPARRGPYRVFVRDSATEFQLVFFHPRGDWIAKNLPAGARRVVSGRVEVFDGIAQMAHPDHILLPAQADGLPQYEPIYPLTAGLGLRAMTKAVTAALDRAPDLSEWADPSLVSTRKWPAWRDALRAAHQPAGIADLAPTSPARARLAYDELLSHQVTLAIARARARRKKGRITQALGKLADLVIAALPYKLTGAQTRVTAEILADMASPQRMSRLLQGDVGAGKTLVALLAMLAAVETGSQAALMAPTEILARQHLQSLRDMAAPADIRIELLTGRDKGAERAVKLAALAAGDIHIIIGTHALFQADIAFADLRLAVVDEQHRFGVKQRLELSEKGKAVDMLVMTATPIPRTLAMSQYGDMDLSLLDEKPAGRKPIETVLVSLGRMDQVIERLRAAIAAGRQAYWVCPLVDESELIALTAAEDRFASLRAQLGEGVVGLVHGQLPPAEKDAAVADFVAGRSRVLVATTVIEVGVNVPSASIMVIEHAENFGLAQLHQLRGRIGRGSEASTCLLLYDAPLGESARARLEIMRETEDGFRIADEDMRLRGAGDVLGTAQSGLPRFRIADLETQAELMAAARKDAQMLLERDPDLTGPRGQAMRVLLYLMDRDAAIRLMSVG